MLSDLYFIDAICHQGYAIIDNFLVNSHYQSLINSFNLLYQEQLFHQAAIGKSKGKHINDSIRKDDIYWLDDNNAFPDVKFYLDAMQNMIAILNQSLFLSLVEYESHFAFYKPGGFYKRHRDQFQGSTNRQISCVYYLNDDWQDNDGGALVLYGDNDSSGTAILPNGNRLVCFRSHMEHEVLVTHKNRLSITTWLKTRA